MSTLNSTRQPVPRELIVVIGFVAAIVFCVLYGKACVLAIAAFAPSLWQSPVVCIAVGIVALLWVAHAIIRDAVLAALREHDRAHRLSQKNPTCVPYTCHLWYLVEQSRAVSGNFEGTQLSNVWSREIAPFLMLKRAPGQEG